MHLVGLQPLQLLSINFLALQPRLELILGLRSHLQQLASSLTLQNGYQLAVGHTSANISHLIYPNKTSINNNKITVNIHKWATLTPTNTATTSSPPSPRSKKITKASSSNTKTPTKPTSSNSIPTPAIWNSKDIAQELRKIASKAAANSSLEFTGSKPTPFKDCAQPSINCT